MRERERSVYKDKAKSAKLFTSREEDRARTTEEERRRAPRRQQASEKTDTEEVTQALPWEPVPSKLQTRRSPTPANPKYFSVPGSCLGFSFSFKF
jgi:hypothetical protein